MAKLNMDQLKHRTWTSRDALVKDLKRSGFPERGEDYEPGETSPGSGMWTLVERGEAEAFGSNVVGGNVNPRKRKATSGKPRVVAAASAASGDTLVETELKKGKVVKLPARVAKGGASKQRDTSKKTEAKEAEVKTDEPPAPVKQTNDFTQPFSYEGKPYTLSVVEGSGFPQGCTHTMARQIAKLYQGTVLVYDKDGKHVDTLEYANMTKKAARSSGGGGRKSTPRDKPTELQEKLIALAIRKEGLTRKDIAAKISDRSLPWTTMIKDCEQFGYRYYTTEAKEGSGARVVYHLEKTKTD